METLDQATLQQYVDNNPDSHLLPRLAAFFLAENDIRAATDLCRQDLTIHPQSALAHFIWALGAEAQDDIDLAVEHFQAVVRCDAYFLSAYYKLVKYSQGYLTPQQLKNCYEQICRLNPFDADIAAKLAALPEDLDMLAVQMKIKPQRQPKTTPPPAAEPTATQAAVEPVPAEEPPTPDFSRPDTTPEVDIAGGAGRLEKFFNSMKEAADLHKQPVVASKPEIPEEEAHFGPLDLSEPDETPAEPEPGMVFDEPASVPSPDAAEKAEGSSISDFFSRLRNKPLEEVQKENWMAEHAMASVQAESPAPKVESPKPTSLKIEEPPIESNPDIIAGKLEKLLAPEPAPHISEQISEESVTPEISAESENPESQPVVTAEKPAETAKPSAPKKRPPRQTKKTSPAANNITFPIPTWTLVDVLTKQKLFEQALSILDIIEAKSKNEKDLEKVQTSRAEIIRKMAEEQSGEA